MPARLPGSLPSRVAPLVAALLCAGSAHAKEAWVNEDSTASLDVSGFYKTSGTGVLMPEGLVANSEALAQLLEQTRQSLPADQAAQLPRFDAIPRQAAVATQAARISARLLWHERIDAEAAWQVGALLASHSTFANGAALGGSPVASGATARRRLVDFDGALVDSGTLRLQHDLDRLSVKVSYPGVDVVVGRQVLAWGSGHLWNPTDLLSPFSPTDIDKEVRKGTDALRVSIPLGTTGLFDALWLPQTTVADQGAVLRAQANFVGYDFSVSAAKYVSDLVFGADFSGDAGPLGVHGEAAYTLGMSGWSDGPLSVDERFVRAVAGVDWKPLTDVVLTAEYYFNGFGAADPSGYLSKMQADRVARGEIFGAGRHYLGLVSSWAASELVTLQGTALVNLGDPSALLMPVVEWSIEQHVLLRGGAFLPVGRGPGSAAVQTLQPADVLGNTVGFQDAVSTLGLRSEYGASAAGVLLQLAVYR